MLLSALKKSEQQRKWLVDENKRLKAASQQLKRGCDEWRKDYSELSEELKKQTGISDFLAQCLVTDGLGRERAKTDRQIVTGKPP